MICTYNLKGPTSHLPNINKDPKALDMGFSGMPQREQGREQRQALKEVRLAKQEVRAGERGLYPAQAGQCWLPAQGWHRAMRQGEWVERLSVFGGDCHGTEYQSQTSNLSCANVVSQRE